MTRYGAAPLPTSPRNRLLSIETWYLQPTAYRRNWTSTLILDLPRLCVLVTSGSIANDKIIEVGDNA